jgi:hypothetical protein
MTVQRESTMDERSEMLATVGRITARHRRAPDVRELVEQWRERLAGSPERKALLLKRLRLFGPIALVVLGVVAYLIFRPMPQPDYRTGNLRKVYTYTLLTDEFNKLPIDKRLELIGQLVQRMKSLPASDSALLAAFAAGIAGKAREQIELNASRLMIDLWDKYAEDYSRRLEHASEADKAAFLDQTALDFVHTIEGITGEMDNKSDTDKLADMRRQAERDKEALSSGKFNPPGQAMGRMFNFMRGNVGEHATPTQRARGQLLMRDMVRHFRGEDGGR